MTEARLDSRRKKTVALSLLALGALAAAGGSYRRRRRASASQEWARKGLVVVLALAVVAALIAVGARHRSSKARDTSSADSPVDQTDGRVEAGVPEAATVGVGERR